MSETIYKDFGLYMESDNKKSRVITEIKRRIDFLISTDKVSDEEKTLISEKALEIIRKAEERRIYESSTGSRD